MMASIPQPSTAVLLANERLLQLRQQQQRVIDSSPAEQTPPWIDNSSTNIEGYKKVPHHLGWGSAAITAHVRQQHRPPQTLTPQSNEALSWVAQLWAKKLVAPTPLSSSKATRTVKCYPDLMVALLRNNLAATGRIWLLLRHLDRNGSGWVTINEARQQLTSPTSELHICGWRQLRNLLTKGKGIFWSRDEQRIWLKGVSSVAQALNIERLSRFPIQLPVSTLTASLADVKAHFYASFHSNHKQNSPISRAAIEKLTTIPARTQLVYEKRAGIQKQQNIAIGASFSEEKIKARAWKSGRSVFKFVDYKGKQGKAEQTYIAWRLPNQYSSSLEHAPKGRMRKINQKLKDLVNKRAQGNSNDVDYQRVYYQDGASAAKRYTRQTTKDDIYWVNQNMRKRPFTMWHVLEAMAS